jgi:hypothetical protein
MFEEDGLSVMDKSRDDLPSALHRESLIFVSLHVDTVGTSLLALVTWGVEELARSF